MDVHTLEKRSYNMSQIKSKGTKPEDIVCKYLFANGFRFRRNDKRYPGKPDIVLPKYKTVIFVNGCYWHKHECKLFHKPDSNTEFWEEKFRKNVERDRRNNEKLIELGWNVITIWECQLKTADVCIQTLENLVAELHSIDTLQ